jgi:ubiquinone/menaquinone biosynthesis C-methylase UbiE
MGVYSRLIFPRVMDLVMSSRVLAAERKRLLEHARGEVLEIGFGTGLNLAHYPEPIRRLTAVEPSAGMDRLAGRRIESSGLEVRRLALGGECLPLPDASFDTVVSTWTLCSIPEVERALGEVRRVLRPGGRFLFVEHGRSPEPKVRRWQDRLDGVQQRLAGGCHLNREIPALIEGAGLEPVEVSRFYMRRTPKILGYTYRGVAVRPEGSGG